jgi:hypothetical protein
VEQLVLKDLPDHKDQLGLLDQMVYKGQLDLPDLSEQSDHKDLLALGGLLDLAAVRVPKVQVLMIFTLKNFRDMKHQLLVLV